MNDCPRQNPAYRLTHCVVDAVSPCEGIPQLLYLSPLLNPPLLESMVPVIVIIYFKLIFQSVD